MEKKLRYNFTIRLFTDEKCFGPGIAKLLHQVQELHSLRAAAISMNMAYSKAWTIIKNSERALGFSLLHSVTGGRGGGGAALTKEGEALLSTYDDFCNEVLAYSDKLFDEKFETLVKTNIE